MGTSGGTVLMIDAVIAGLLAVVLALCLRPAWAALPGTVRVHAEDIGFLAGGPGRAYLTALGALVESGRIRCRDGRVETVPGAVGATAVEQSVLMGLAGGVRPRHLITTPATAEAFLTLAGLWLSYLVGWICVFTGVAGSGVGFVVAALVVIGGALCAVTRACGRVVPARSRALVAHLRRGAITSTGSRGERMYAGRVLVDRAAGMAVALGGVAALRVLDPAMASSLEASRIAAVRDVSGGSSGFLGDRRADGSGYAGAGGGCGSGGSSCGGSGCGGGGCGGGGS